jgi:hypothetical protein
MNNVYEYDIEPLEKCFYEHMNTELEVGMLVVVEYIKYSDTEINIKFWRGEFDIHDIET